MFDTDIDDVPLLLVNENDVIKPNNWGDYAAFNVCACMSVSQ